MKKFLLTIVAIFMAACAYAQKDTILVVDPINWENETITTKNGKIKNCYYAFYKGNWYDSNKTSVERYNLIKRFGGIPTVVAIIDKKKNQIIKIIVL